MTQNKQEYEIEVRENEEGENYTLLLDSEGNEIASHWGKDGIEDFADEIAAHREKETPVAQSASSPTGQTEPDFNYAENAAICDEARTVAESFSRMLGWNSVDAYNAILQGVSIAQKRSINNARLIAEAGTVATETGLTPRQLADQRAELLAACHAAMTHMTALSADPVNWPITAYTVKAAIDKAEGRQ